jgi:hypothetical protein
MIQFGQSRGSGRMKRRPSSQAFGRDVVKRPRKTGLLPASRSSRKSRKRHPISTATSPSMSREEGERTRDWCGLPRMALRHLDRRSISR